MNKDLRSYYSSCCGSEVIVKGDVTKFYVCDECQKPCDAVPYKKPFTSDTPKEEVWDQWWKCSKCGGLHYSLYHCNESPKDKLDTCECAINGESCLQCSNGLHDEHCQPKDKPVCKNYEPFNAGWLGKDDEYCLDRIKSRKDHIPELRKKVESVKVEGKNKLNRNFMENLQSYFGANERYYYEMTNKEFNEDEAVKDISFLLSQQKKRIKEEVINKIDSFLDFYNSHGQDIIDSKEWNKLIESIKK